MTDENKKKILIVDDDSNLNTVLVDKLNFSGFDAVGAPDGEEGLKKSVVVVATSDLPPLIRLKAAFVATAIAEYFRDSGKNVILMFVPQKGGKVSPPSEQRKEVADAQIEDKPGGGEAVQTDQARQG